MANGIKPVKLSKKSIGNNIEIEIWGTNNPTEFELRLSYDIPKSIDELSEYNRNKIINDGIFNNNANNLNIKDLLGYKMVQSDYDMFLRNNIISYKDIKDEKFLYGIFSTYIFKYNFNIIDDTYPSKTLTLKFNSNDYLIVYDFINNISRIIYKIIEEHKTYYEVTKEYNLPIMDNYDMLCKIF